MGEHEIVQIIDHPEWDNGVAPHVEVECACDWGGTGVDEAAARVSHEYHVLKHTATG